MNYLKSNLLRSAACFGTVLTLMPLTSLASFSETLAIFYKTRAIEVSSPDILRDNPALRYGINNIYESIIASLQNELDLLSHPQTTSVDIKLASYYFSKSSLVTIDFSRKPEDSSAPVDFFIENSSKAIVGVLANQVMTNVVKWQVAENFVGNMDYYISAKDRDGNLLGRSSAFRITPKLINLPVTSVPAVQTTVSTTTMVVPTNSTITPTNFSVPDINIGALGYWSFDGNANSCATKGKATIDYSGKIGSSIFLDGNGSYCSVSNDRNFYPKNFSISVWAKSDVTHTNMWKDSNWFVSLHGKSGFSVGPIAGTTNVQFVINDDMPVNPVLYNVGFVSLTNISDWHHYAMTYDGSTANIYLDGQLATSSALVINRPDADMYDLLFGSYDDRVTQTQFGAGNLDEIRLYNRALSACEIRILAGKTCGGFSMDSSGRQVANVITAGEAIINRLNALLNR